MNRNTNLYLQFLIILLPQYLTSFFRLSIGLLLPGFKLVYGASNEVGGFVVSSLLALTGVGIAVSGYLTARWGERKVSLLGMAIFSIAIGSSPLMSSISLFAVLFGLCGFATGLMTTPLYSMATNIFPSRTGVATGFLSAAFNLGGFAGPAITGYLLFTYDWQAPFFVTSSTASIFFVLFLVGTRNYKPDRIITGRSYGAFRALIRKKNILIVLVCMFLGDVASYSHTAWTPDYLLSAFHLGIKTLPTIGFYFGLGFGLGGVGVILAGYLFDKIGGRITAIITGLACTVASIGLYFSFSFGLALFALVFVGFLFNWFWGVLSAMVQTHVRKEERPSAISLAQTSGLIGAAVGPSAVGLMTGNALLTKLPMLIGVSLPYIIFTSLFLSGYSDAESTGVSLNKKEGS